VTLLFIKIIKSVIFLFPSKIFELEKGFVQLRFKESENIENIPTGRTTSERVPFCNFACLKILSGTQKTRTQKRKGKKNTVNCCQSKLSGFSWLRLASGKNADFRRFRNLFRF